MLQKKLCTDLVNIIIIRRLLSTAFAMLEIIETPARKFLLCIHNMNSCSVSRYGLSVFFTIITFLITSMSSLLKRNGPKHVEITTITHRSIFFYRKSTTGTTIAAIWATKDTYCLQKRIEKFPLAANSSPYRYA